jgi:hypothetical protein
MTVFSFILTSPMMTDSDIVLFSKSEGTLTRLHFHKKLC